MNNKERLLTYHNLINDIKRLRMIHDKIISKNIRIRIPDSFFVGKGSIIDDYCYFSTKVTIGKYSHIANNVSVGGGPEFEFRLGDYSSISSGVRIWCVSDDFTEDIAALLPVHILNKRNIEGDVSIENLTIVGSNSVIMPNNVLPIGVAIGALSLVPTNYKFEPWTLYGGIPIKPLKKRNKTKKKFNKLFISS